MGKTSGGIRQNLSNTKIKVSTGNFGDAEFWRLTNKENDLIIVYPKNKYTESQAIKDYKIKNTKNG